MPKLRSAASVVLGALVALIMLALPAMASVVAMASSTVTGGQSVQIENAATHRCLDTFRAHTSLGTPVGFYKCNKADKAEQFRFTHTGIRFIYNRYVGVKHDKLVLVTADDPSAKMHGAVAGGSQSFRTIDGWIASSSNSPKFKTASLRKSRYVNGGGELFFFPDLSGK